jgi:hypothetical protein
VVARKNLSILGLPLFLGRFPFPRNSCSSGDDRHKLSRHEKGLGLQAVHSPFRFVGTENPAVESDGPFGPTHRQNLVIDKNPKMGSP